jgi:hypothetical protein
MGHYDWPAFFFFFFSGAQQVFKKLIRIKKIPKKKSKSLATLLLLHMGFKSGSSHKLFKNVFVSFHILLLVKFD